MARYYLANQGQTCTDYCEKGRQLNCSSDMEFGDDNGVAVINHLAHQQPNISTCLEGWLGNQWWAPDQPNYVSDPSDPNFNRCVRAPCACVRALF